MDKITLGNSSNTYKGTAKTIADQALSVKENIPANKTLKGTNAEGIENPASASLYDKSIRVGVLGTAETIGDQALPLQMAVKNGQINLKFTAQNDWQYIYQIQSSSDLVNWNNVSNAYFIGDGLTHEITHPMGKSKEFFRVAVSTTDVSPEERAYEISRLRGEGDIYFFRNFRESLLDDKDVALAAVRVNGFSLQHVSDRLKGDYDVVLAAARSDYRVLEFASDRLKDDKDFMLAAVAGTYGHALQFASDRLKDDYDVALAATQRDYRELENVSDRLKDDKDFMLAAVAGTYGHALQFASDRLKDDYDVALVAAQINYRELENVSDRLKDDKNFMLDLIKVNLNVLHFASDRLKDDKDFMLVAVTETYGQALHFASDRLKNDKDVVLAAVSINYKTFPLASERLKDDKDVVLAAVQNEYWVRQLGNEGNLEDGLVNGNLLLGNVSKSLLDDNDFMLSIVGIDIDRDIWRYALEYASDRLKGDKDFMLVVVNKDYRLLEYASDDLKKDADFMLAAAQSDYRALQYASDDLKKDEDFMLDLIKVNLPALQFASDDLKDDADFMLAAVNKNYRVLYYASDSLKDDKDFMLVAAQSDYRVLEFASDRLLDDKDFIRSLYSQFPTLVEKFKLLNAYFILKDRTLTLSDLSEFNTRIGNIDIIYGIEQPHFMQPSGITINEIWSVEDLKEISINGTKFLQITGFYSHHGDDYYRGVYLVNTEDGSTISCSNAGGDVKKLGDRFVVSAQFDSYWYPQDNWGPRYQDVFTKQYVNISTEEWDALPLYSEE